MHDATNAENKEQKKPAPKDRRATALELKHTACKGTAATLGNKAATVGVLAHAMADAISAANADLTAIATAAKTSVEHEPAACKGTAATLRDKVATIGALAHAGTDAISAAKADLTARVTVAITSGALKPAACKGTTMISQHTRASSNPQNFAARANAAIISGGTQARRLQRHQNDLR